ncbi:MAG: serine acetyltransferase [Pseudomonadota bacterium]
MIESMRIEPEPALEERSPTPFIVSATEPNWSRERPRAFWDPGRKLLKTIRDYQRLKFETGLLTAARRRLIVLRHRFWSIVTASDIPLSCTGLGGGLKLPHPLGIVIHPKTILGPNCLIMHHTTLMGSKTTGITAGGHIDFGAGSKILANVKIGKHVSIGANAVVTKTVDDYAIVAGVPAKKIGENTQAKAAAEEKVRTDNT